MLDIKTQPRHHCPGIKLQFSDQSSVSPMFLFLSFFFTSLGLVSLVPEPFEDSLNLEDILSFRGSEEGSEMAPDQGGSPTLLVENKESSKVGIQYLNIKHTVN